MKKYLQLFFEQAMGSYLNKYIKTAQINLREWQKWQQLLILYINIVTLWCYSWESRMYSNNYQAMNSAGNVYNCIHTYARMLTFCVTAIIYYIIIYSAYAFIKSTNMIYHNCVYQGAVNNINQICKGTFWSQSLWSVYNKYSFKYL